MHSVILRDNGWNRHSLHRLMAVFENMRPPVAWTVVDGSDDLAREISREPSAVIGYSFMTAAWPAARDEIMKLRAAHPAVRIIAGGPHPSAMPDEVLAAGVDTVFVGESEGTLPKFWERHVICAAGALWPRTVEAGEVLPMDDIPPFSRCAGRFAPVEITRGCGHACRFCQTPAIFRGPVRHRSVERLRPWLIEQVKLGKPRLIVLSPNALSYRSVRAGEPNLDALAEFFDACVLAGLRQVVFGDFPSEVRPEYVTAGAVRLMKKYCDNRKVTVGAQSASDGMLQRCGRGHSADAVEEAVRRLSEAGFFPVVDHIFGMPGETDEDRDAFLGQVRRLRDISQFKINAHYFMPLPGTAWAGETPVVLPDGFVRELHRLEAAGILEVSSQRSAPGFQRSD